MKAAWVMLAVLLLLTTPVLATSIGEQWIRTRSQTGTYALTGFGVFNTGTNITVVGGLDTHVGSDYLGAVWTSFNGTDWSVMNTSAFFGAGRAYMMYAYFDSKLWVMGGKNGTAY